MTARPCRRYREGQLSGCVTLSTGQRPTAITVTYPNDETNDPNADIPAVRGALLDLNGYDPALQVSEQLAYQRGVSAADYSDTAGRGCSSPHRPGTAGEAAEVANDATAIVVELFNAESTVPADVVFLADIAEPAR